MPRHRENDVDLGLELLLVRRGPSASFTYREIAAWAGTSHQYIYEIERRAVRKLIRACKRKFGAEILNHISRGNQQ